MGIACKEHIAIKTQGEFHAIDKIATGFAFDIQNAVGTFCDETIYQEVLAFKCNNAFIKAQREVEILVAYRDFSKIYKMDLLLDSGIIYELKTVKSLNAAHRQQMQLLDNQTAFHVSSINKAIGSYEKNIQRLISHTVIETVQWVNFNKDKLVLKTLSNKY